MSESARIVLCPYCGNTQTQPDRCAECGGLFEPLSRRATQIAMGPWYIRDKAKPFRPGCSFDVVKKQVQAGRIKPTTIMRGPTTRQFWTVARHVPGVSHLLGYCYKCDTKVSPTDRRCPRCSAIFNEPWQRNELGLLYPSTNDANAAQKALDREIESVLARGGAPAPGNITGPMSAARPAATPSAPAKAPGADLLDEVIGKGGGAPAKPTAPPRATPPPIPPAARPAPSQPKPLDFTPSDENARAGNNGGDGSQSRSNMLVLVLFILVILMLIVQVYSMFRTPAPTGANIPRLEGYDEPTPLPPPTAPSAPAAPSAPSTPAPSSSRPTAPTPPPPPAKAFTPMQPAETPASRVEAAPAVVAPTPEVKVEEAKPAAPLPTPTPEAKSVEPAAAPAAPIANSDFQARFREAERLENAGKFAEALASFQVLSATAPDKKSRDEVSAAVRRLEFKVQSAAPKTPR